MENWKAIPSYKGIYEVSDLGRVRRISGIYKGASGFLKGDIIKGGYSRVKLCKNGKWKRFMIHRLVLLTFVGPAPKGKVAHHKNAITSDARLKNLEYVTPGQNNQYAYDMGKQKKKGELHWKHKVTNEQVLEIRKIRGTLEDFSPTTKRGPRKTFHYPKKHPSSFHSLSKKFNLCPAMISHICNRKNWTHI